MKPNSNRPEASSLFSEARLHFYCQLFLVWALLFEILPFLDFATLRSELVKIGDNTYLRAAASLLAICALVLHNITFRWSGILVVLAMATLYARQVKFYLFDIQGLASQSGYQPPKFLTFSILVVYALWLFAIASAAWNIARK